MNPSEVLLNGNEQLWELSREQAGAVLTRFLEIESEFFSRNPFSDLMLDLSSGSVKRLFHFVLESGQYVESQAAIWDLRCGYYFGQSLIAQSSRLHWTIGEAGYAFENHPVVAGFADDIEAPLITISHNILSSVNEGRSGIERIDSSIDLHFQNISSASK